MICLFKGFLEAEVEFLIGNLMGPVVCHLSSGVSGSTFNLGRGGLFKLGRISIVRAAALFSLGVTVNPFGNLVDYIVKIVKIYPFDVMTTFL